MTDQDAVGDVAPSKPELRRKLLQLLLATGLIGIGGVAGRSTWILPGAEAEPVFGEVSVHRPVQYYPGHPPAYPLGFWVLRIPFSEPCRVRLDVRAVQGLGAHRFFVDSDRLAEVHEILVSALPLAKWEKVPVAEAGLGLEHVDLHVTSAGGETRTWTWDR